MIYTSTSRLTIEVNQITLIIGCPPLNFKFRVIADILSIDSILPN